MILSPQLALGRPKSARDTLPSIWKTTTSPGLNLSAWLCLAAAWPTRLLGTLSCRRLWVESEKPYQATYCCFLFWGRTMSLYCNDPKISAATKWLIQPIKAKMPSSCLGMNVNEHHPKPFKTLLHHLHFPPWATIYNMAAEMQNISSL